MQGFRYGEKRIEKDRKRIVPPRRVPEGMQLSGPQGRDNLLLHSLAYCSLICYTARIFKILKILSGLGKRLYFSLFSGFLYQQV